MRVFLLILVFVCSVPMLALGPAVASGVGDPVLVIAPPWRDAAQIVASAGGQMIGLERAPMAVLAYGVDAGFHTRLIEQGAWLVRDGAMIAKLC